jgi:hypothetical protein
VGSGCLGFNFEATPTCCLALLNLGANKTVEAGYYRAYTGQLEKIMMQIYIF